MSKISILVEMAAEKGWKGGKHEARRGKWEGGRGKGEGGSAKHEGGGAELKAGSSKGWKMSACRWAGNDGRLKCVSS